MDAKLLIVWRRLFLTRYFHDHCLQFNFLRVIVGFVNELDTGAEPLYPDYLHCQTHFIFRRIMMANPMSMQRKGSFYTSIPHYPPIMQMFFASILLIATKVFNVRWIIVWT